MKLNIIICFILLNFGSILTEDVAVVKTPLGEVLGSLHQTPGWRDYYGFQGIRYAEPPVGNLRWKPAIPVKPWDEIFDARSMGPWCHQHNVFFKEIFEVIKIQFSEDCLRINVATHNLNEAHGKLLPVVVDFHGGAFTAGGSGFAFVKPTYLMQHDIVHVSLNYRVGVLGFLSAGTAEVPGNVGLKDQVLALKWVQQNIRSFGGDPDNVTIMGYSAGGYSVSGHLLSPMSAGLFNRGIAMSGSMVNHFLLPETHQLDLFNKVANTVGCSHGSSIHDKVECLRKTPAQDLENVLGTLFQYGACPLFTIVPILEQDFGQERFFIEQPAITLTSGNFNKVPVVAGMAKDELAGFAHLLLSNETIRYKLEHNFDEIAPVCFMYEENTEKSKHITEVLQKEFISSHVLHSKEQKCIEVEPNIDEIAPHCVTYKDEHTEKSILVPSFQNSPESLTELQKPFGDSAIGHGMHRLVQLLNTQVNVYYYKFSFIGRISGFNYPDKSPWGVDHSDELQYIFATPLRPPFDSSHTEYKTIQRFTKLIANFAENGEPNRTEDEVIGNFKWTPFNKDNQNYLNIGNELEMQSELYLDRFRVWDELFPVTSD